MRYATLLHCLIVLPCFAQPPSPAEAVDQQRLMDTLRQLPTSRAAWGDEAGQKGLRDTEAWVEKQLKDLGYEPKVHEFRWAPRVRPKEGEPAPTPVESTWKNFIVEIPGKSLPGEVLIVGAHFDAVPGAPGADDNGTGTAGLVELARVLKDRPMKRTVRLIFFNLEEAGLVGSSRYVQEHKELWKKPEPPAPPDAPGGTAAKPAEAPAGPREKVVGMLSLEMLGFFSDEPNSQTSPIQKIEGVFDPPTVGDSIAVVGIARDRAFIQQLTGAMAAAAPGLKLTIVDFLPVPVPDMMRSDHRPFVMAGLPGVMVTDTANFRNPNYHKPTDAIETIDPARFTLVVRAIAGATWSIAEPAE